MSRHAHDPELGIVKRCTKCEDWWPLDEEFFYRDKRSRDGYMGYCRDCYLEKKAASRERVLRRAVLA